MEVVAISLKHVSSEGLTRLADSLGERRAYVVAEIDYRAGCDARIMETLKTRRNLNMEVVAISLKHVSSEGLTRLADSLESAIAQPHTVVRALGLTHDNLRERRAYVVAEIDKRYHAGCDARVTEWVENQWFDADTFDRMILSIPVAHPAQLTITGVA